MTITVAAQRRVLGYVRVSTERQAGEHHASLQTQEAHILDYIERAGDVHVETFVDILSGRRDDRPEYNRMALTEILISVPDAATKINWEKVSKRKCLDIASVNSALRVWCEDGVIREAALAMGGVAPVPLFMARTSDYLVGKPVSVETVEGAMLMAQDEIAPISDVRGSAAYKRLLVRQFLVAHFTRLFPEDVSVEAFD